MRGSMVRTAGGGGAAPGTLEDVGELYAQHAASVRRRVGAGVRAPDPLIEDACQIAWSRLVHHRTRVHRETATSWLVRTAIHEALRLIRRGGRELSLDELVDGNSEAQGSRTPQLLDELVEQRAVLDAIRILPERQGRLLWLQALGFTYAEIAGETGDTTRTVERQLARGRRRLARETGR
ncbi:MAG: sigma-70 family RNA polymerase sigma factor [Solirubrobacterales bacterium]|nr:sigma-70 family RNA polymerase sigma factor [Solirubrobacterales bacterium]